MDIALRPQTALAGKIRSASISDARQALLQRGWDKSVVNRVLEHGGERVIRQLLNPGVEPWTYHRGVGAPLRNYDPSYSSPGILSSAGLWACPRLEGFPISKAVQHGPQNGFILRMQLPAMPGVDEPAKNTVRHIPRFDTNNRIEVPDDRLFILAIGTPGREAYDVKARTKDGGWNIAPPIHWMSYEDAVRDGLIKGLEASKKARTSPGPTDEFV